MIRSEVLLVNAPHNPYIFCIFTKNNKDTSGLIVMKHGLWQEKSQNFYGIILSQKKNGILLL